MATQLDWYNTLLATESGRKVFFELRMMVYTWHQKKKVEPVAQCALDSLILMIREKCGINTEDAEMRLIEYEAAIAASLLDKEEPKPQDVNLHETM